MRPRRLSIVIFVAAICLQATPVGEEFDLVGWMNDELRAHVTLYYDGLSTLTISIENNSLTPWGDPRITGFAFNLPGGITGVDSFSGPEGWHRLFDPNSINTPGQFGFFDVAGLTGPNFDGGHPNAGIPVGQTFTFSFAFTGNNLDVLSAAMFREAYSDDPAGNPVEATQYFVARFQRDDWGDVAYPSDTLPPQGIPEPGTLALLGAGMMLCGLLRRRTR